MKVSEHFLSKLYNDLDKELIDQFQIVLSNADTFDALKPDKYRIYYVHNTEYDDVVQDLGENWQKFHRLVFVSNWQMQRFIAKFNIPWSKCVVLTHAIEPIDTMQDDEVKLIYHAPPTHGLFILIGAFDKLLEKYPNLSLDIFGLDSEGPMLDFVKKHEKIRNFGVVPNNIVRKALADNNYIFAYPSVVPVPSSVAVLEAMSAGAQVIHPNYGGLFELSNNMNLTYQWDENVNNHAQKILNLIDGAITMATNPHNSIKTQNQKMYVDSFYNWKFRKMMWDAFLRSIVGEPKELPKETFTYKV